MRGSDGSRGSEGQGRPEEPSRSVTDLPELQAFTPQEGSVLAGDWITQQSPVIGTMSATSGVWWAEVLREAYHLYTRWLVADPVQRLSIKAEATCSLTPTSRHVLVEQRLTVLLMRAVPTEIRAELVAVRAMSSLAVVVAVLCRYQPGGPNERANVLAFLVAPERPNSIENGIATCRRWLRQLQRAKELGLMLPDATLLIKGADALLGPVLTKSQQASFRLNSFRNERKLDYAPAFESIVAFGQLILAEYELLQHSEPGEPKKPKINKVQENDEEGQPKGGKGKQGSGKSSATDAGTGKGAKPGSYSKELGKATCKYWCVTDLGCVKDTAALLKNLKIKKIDTGRASARALLDSGATACMRTARPGELTGLPERTVQLAQGEVRLRVNEGGTLLTSEPVDPIVSLHKLCQIGYRVDWSREGGCQVRCPGRMALRVYTDNGCPEVERQAGLDLIQEIEVFQVLARIPVTSSYDASKVAWNRRQRRTWLRSKAIALHLFSGPQKKFWELPRQNAHCVCVDIQENLLDDQTFSFLESMALSGRLCAVLGGPPCKTFSLSRYMPPGLPRPLRGRSKDTQWGFGHLTPSEKEAITTDGVLMFRMVWLYLIAEAMAEELNLPRTWLDNTICVTGILTKALWATKNGSLPRSFRASLLRQMCKFRVLAMGFVKPEIQLQALGRPLRGQLGRPV
ncbi:unnamed protein product [Symbiodinium pilosum]|uniref:Uncharacterized protein n=1 Tax=Symbiodinium pilosum TaxID=2952 RepID=A0A812Q7C7_SYMPI|nr:unnamed protein product [Symbiodinium pilosum]